MSFPVTVLQIFFKKKKNAAKQFTSEELWEKHHILAILSLDVSRKRLHNAALNAMNALFVEDYHGPFPQ